MAFYLGRVIRYEPSLNDGLDILTPSWTVPVISGKITVGGHYDEEQQCSEPSGY